MELKLYKYLLYKICYNLNITDILSLNQTCKYINNVLNDNYFWQEKIKLDFIFDNNRSDTIFDKSLYKSIYIGEMIITDHKLCIFNDNCFKQGPNVLIPNNIESGIAAIFLSDYHEQLKDVIYYAGNWENDIETFKSYLTKDCDHSLNIYYIPLNKLSLWHTKFHIGNMYHTDKLKFYNKLYK